MEKKSIDSMMSRRIVTMGFVMTCVIVLFHCGSGDMTPVSSADAGWNNFFTQFFSNLRVLAMSYFFTATGYLFSYGFRMTDYRQKIKRRVSSLLVPYILWQLLFGVVFCGILRESSLSSCMQAIFCLQKWPPDGPLWYMYVVFLLALGNPLLYMLFRNKKIGFISLLLLLTLIQIIRTSENTVLHALYAYGYLSNIFTYLPAYLTAAYIGLHAGETDRDLGTIAGLLLAALLLDAWLDGFLKFYTIRLIPLLLLYLLPDSCLIHAPILTNLSFLLYALHRTFTGACAGQIRVLLQGIRSAAFLNFFGRVFTFLIILGFTWIFWRLLSRFAPGLLKILTGGRTKAYSAFHIKND